MATRVNKKKTTSKKAAAKKPAAKKKATKAKPAAAKKKAAKAKPAAAKKKAARKKPLALVISPAELKEKLSALPSTLDKPIDFGVAQILAETKELLGIGELVGDIIMAHSRVPDGAFDDLALRERYLDHAQRSWQTTRRRTASAALIEAREKAEGIETPLFAELRHFIDIPAVQTRLDEIQVGDDDPDTVQDLRELADLHDDHKEDLAKAQLPADVATQARTAADELEKLITEKNTAAFNANAEALGLRNRAFWHLRQLVDLIRSGGRHVFREDTRRRKWFLASSTRKVKRAAVGRPPKAKAPRGGVAKAPDPKDEPKA